mmetsp:Transcript_66282/g.151593  ORF Transcript_66282/g.151593 Transcript_66282/m.151593 type:complete len:629 (+) Transcript_66282:19-1905(+)
MASASSGSGPRPAAQPPSLQLPAHSTRASRSNNTLTPPACGGGDTQSSRAAELERGLYDEINALRRPKSWTTTELLRLGLSDHGCSSAIAGSRAFELVTLGVIVANAVWIGYDTETNRAPTIAQAATHVVVVENCFCVYFTTELLIRFLAFDKPSQCLSDNWFRFDAFLVGLMVTETWVVLAVASSTNNLDVLRPLRLLRLARVMRLMTAVPELLMLAKGMVAATRSVVSIFVLLVLALYVWACIFAQQTNALHKDHIRLLNLLAEDLLGSQLSDEDKEACGLDTGREIDPIIGLCSPDWDSQLSDLHASYGTVPRAMFTLFGGGTILDDLNGTLQLLRNVSPALHWAFIAFILFSSFGLLNMLVGVLCEVISATAEGERNGTMLRLARERFSHAYEIIDADKSGRISLHEFSQMHEYPQVQATMQLLGIEERHLRTLALCIFETEDPDALEEEAMSPASEDAEADPSEHVAHLVQPKMVAARRSNPALPCSRKPRRKSQIHRRELGVDEFLEGVIQLRPQNDASVLDICELRRGLRDSSRRMDDSLSDFCTALHDVTRRQRDWNNGRTTRPRPVGSLPNKALELTVAEFDILVDRKLTPLRSRVLGVQRELEMLMGARIDIGPLGFA